MNNPHSTFSQYWEKRGITCEIPAIIEQNIAHYISHTHTEQKKFQRTYLSGHNGYSAFQRLNYPGDVSEYLYIPNAWNDYTKHKIVYVAEGISDTLSLKMLGLPCVGMRSKGAVKSGGINELNELITYAEIKTIVVMPDSDGWDVWCHEFKSKKYDGNTLKFVQFRDIRNVFASSAKDINDLLVEIKDRKRIRETIQQNFIHQYDVKEIYNTEKINEIVTADEIKSLLCKHSNTTATRERNQWRIKGQGGLFVSNDKKISKPDDGKGSGQYGIIGALIYTKTNRWKPPSDPSLMRQIIKEAAELAGICPSYIVDKKHSAIKTKNEIERDIVSNTLPIPECPRYTPKSTIEIQDGYPSLKYYECSEFGWKERFLDSFEDIIRYNHTIDNWMLYDGKRWKPDEKKLAYEMANRLILSVSQDSQSIKNTLPDVYHKKTQETYVNKKERAEKKNNQLRLRIKQSSSLKNNISHVDKHISYAHQVHQSAYEARQSLHKTINLMSKNCSHSPRVSTTQPEYDTDPYLLNLQNGTLHLKTGEFRKHQQCDLLSKIMGTCYDEKATCPTFDNGLNLMFDGDGDMADYVLRLVALSLPGTSDEKVLPFCYGAEGDNGKSTFILMLKMLLGNYFGEIPMEALLVGKRQANAPDENLAGLQGKRFVMAPEANNYKINGSLVKMLTGGDPITARVLHGHNMTFDPSHNLWIIGNKKPHVDADDPAIWIRLKLIEFCVIPKNKQMPRDDVLTAYKKELPGILNKVLDAGRRAKENWLTSQDAPEKVIKATDEYRKDADNMADFIEEYCDTWEQLREQMLAQNPSAKPEHLREQSTSLASAYKQWCQSQHDSNLQYHKNQFYDAMQKKGYKRELGSGNKLFFYGIQLKEREENPF
jgi:P4 family phage/plasmid primase-like protien